MTGPWTAASAGATIPPEVQADATVVASAYLEILNPDGAMDESAVDAFNVGVQAGITAALEVLRRGARGGA